MKEFLQHGSAMFYLGLALGIFANIYFYDWRFYAIGVPTIILIVWGQEGGD